MIEYEPKELKNNFFKWLEENNFRKPDFINSSECRQTQNRVIYFCHWINGDASLNIDFIALFRRGKFYEFKQVTNL